MRRFIYSILIVLLSVSFIFATSKPSLDGRAVVADEGVLPVGLFAKTVGYLPGDSVSVTNPATGITINVLILGSIDPSAGVAILLSPEAADKLFITPDSNTQVKITKRTGMLDESVSGSGTVVSTTPTDALPDSLAEDLDAKLDTVDVALGTPETPTEPVDEPVEEVAEPVAAEPEPVVEVAEPETPPVETNEVDMALVPPPAEPTTEEIDEASRYTITSVEEIPQDDILSTEDPVYIVEVLGEETTEPVEEPIETTDALAAIDTVEPEIEPIETPEEELTVLVPDVGATESIASVDEPLEEDPALIDPFAPIILVPAGENPPEEDLEKDIPTTIKPVPVAPVAEPVIPPPAESAIAKNVSPKDLVANRNNMVKSLSELERGKYYVQVATFAEQENIDNMLRDYGNKYPFVMVPLKSGSAMQMMVGPLNVDEYGAVLARFKSLGFKDSFLRKIR